MRDMCSMHCGHLSGVSKQAFDKARAALEKLFEAVRYEAEYEMLHVCGAREIEDSPGKLSEILDMLAGLLSEKGKGHIMMRCEGITEVCYFRRNMWKLAGIELPPDPFEGIHYVS